MLQHLVAGHWGIIIRRPLESATRTLPLMVVAFLPIAVFGMHYLYSGHDKRERLAQRAADWRRRSLRVSEELPHAVNGFLHSRGHLFCSLALLMFIFNVFVEAAGRQARKTALCAFASKCWPVRASFFTFS